jgi:hypothetical protein
MPCSLVEICNSIIKYGIIFGGNLSNSKIIFTLLYTREVTMVGAKPRNSRRSLINRADILPLPCQYILSLMNLENCQTNSAVHSINTRNKHQLYRPVASLSCLQNCNYYVEIKIFSSLPSRATKAAL